MPKTAKKKPWTSRRRRILKAMENVTFETADPDGLLQQLRNKLSAAGLDQQMGSIVFAGRVPSPQDSGYVMFYNGSGTYWGSYWPEWAYGVAEDALHFNKRMQIYYTSGQPPVGSNLAGALCWNTSV